MIERRGLLIPFQRDRKRDFASGTGADLLRSKVIQALLTDGAAYGSDGELPWRTSLGAALGRLRHQRNDAVLGELARVTIRDALARWVPSAKLVALHVVQDDAQLTVKLRVRERGTEAQVQLPVSL